MKLLILILNLPVTIIGLVPMLLSGPYRIRFKKNPYAIVCNVKKFWWVFGYMKHARAMTIGHVILLGPRELPNDLEHEIIHVKQAERYPLIQPVLYLYELIKNGYRQNRFEVEAYTLSNSIYEGAKSSRNTRA